MHEDVRRGFRLGCGFLLAKLIAAAVFFVVALVVVTALAVIVTVAVHGGPSAFWEKIHAPGGVLGPPDTKPLRAY